MVGRGVGVGAAVGTSVAVGAPVGVAAGLVIWGRGVIGNCAISTVGVTDARDPMERRPNVISSKPIVNTARAESSAMRIGWGVDFCLGSKRVFGFLGDRWGPCQGLLGLFATNDTNSHEKEQKLVQIREIRGRFCFCQASNTQKGDYLEISIADKRRDRSLQRLKGCRVGEL